MKKATTAVMAAALIFGAGSLLVSTPAHAQASATVGSLRGALHDKGHNNEAAVGATVVATSPSLQGEQVVITDDTGQYFITSLPSGVYTLTVYYNDATFSRGNVVIQVGKEAVVNVTVDSAANTAGKKGETIVIKGTAPIIDQGSTKTGVVLTDDYTRNIPVGRTFGEVLGSAAGAQGDLYGESISGATSVENTYIVEGINTTDTAYGRLSANLPNEFVSETEVITGGYNAEYGRATGGIVNVVTKSGSNEIHGSVFGYFKPGALTSAAQTIQTQGGSIDSQTNLNYDYDFGAELGGPIIKDKVWFHVGFNPSIAQSTETRLIQQQIDKNQDGKPDLDSSGNPIHQKVASSDIPAQASTYFFTSKINAAYDQNNQFQISAFGNPEVGNQIASFNDITNSPQNQLLHYTQGAYDVSAKWTSKLNDGKTQIDAVAGFHRGYGTQDTSQSPSGNQALTYYGYTRPLYDFADLEGANTISACNDANPNNPYPKLAAAGQTCPVTNYAEGGLGLLENRVNDRATGVISVSQRVKALGYHTFKAGLDIEASTYDTVETYTGGSVLKRSADTDADTPGPWLLEGFDSRLRNLTQNELDNPMSVVLQPGQTLCGSGRAICQPYDHLAANTSSTSIGAYLQDSWQIRPNFTVNYGARYERQTAYNGQAQQGTISPTGETIPQQAFALNNWAPRIGFIFDPTQEGKAKIFGNWGRFYENIPMDASVRSFGGEIDNIQLVNANQTPRSSPMFNPACAADHTAGMPAGKILAGCTDIAQLALFGDNAEYVTPGIQGEYTQELVLGTEYEIAPDFTVGMNYVHRTMPMVIEDVLSPNGGYFLTNPGQNFDSEAETLHTQAMTQMASSDPAVKELGAVNEYRSQQMLRIKDYDIPSRDYDALQITVRQRPTSHSLVLASYTYSVEKGNYPGLFSTETGQLDPNITSQYDLPALLANRYGFLGLDRPHNLKIDGFYMFDLHKLGLLTVGASVRGESGIAHNALGSDPVYGQGEAYLLPRGTYPRSPFTEQLDIHVAYGYKLNKGTKLEGFVNIFNLFDQQDELNEDENYTFDNALPIVGGDPSDLKHLKALDASGAPLARTVIPNLNFGQVATNANGVLARQLPRSVQFGARLTF